MFQTTNQSSYQSHTAGAFRSFVHLFGFNTKLVTGLSLDAAILGNPKNMPYGPWQ